jgi:Glycosyl transferase family 2
VATASIVIPAHNEERGIGRLLDALAGRGSTSEFELIVVCNGCTDATVDVAGRYAPAVRVIELPEPSKRAALKRGDREATTFPRLYVDSDVDLDASSARALVAALRGPVLAAAPVRVIPRDGASWVVRAYYDVWEQLPQVQSAPFGRGVVAISEAGHERIRDLPPAMSDDLAMTAVFDDPERTVVAGARVVIRPPRTARDLVRRRIRVNTGNAELDRVGARPDSLRTSPGMLLDIARRRPALAPKLVVYVGVVLAGRIGARRRIRRGDFHTWLRDDSSRRGSS